MTNVRLKYYIIFKAHYMSDDSDTPLTDHPGISPGPCPTGKGLMVFHSLVISLYI